MKQATQSSFNEGLLMDMNPLVTPQTCLTDCLNGTIITYNGNEFTLQNDMGNVKISDSEITQGFIPIGMKEYGGIIYLALFNPDNNECEIGSIPSPNYAKSVTSKDRNPISIISETSGNETYGFSFAPEFYKLFEPEELELNPGDKYAIGYKVAITSTDILDSSSINYNVELFAIDSNNKEYKLENPNLIKLSNTEDSKIVESDYKHFNHTIRSVLGLKISLNEVDFFDTSVTEHEDGFHFIFYGKNKFKNKDLSILGCKIESNNNVDYIYSDNINDEKYYQTAIMEKFGSDGEIVEFTVTPFDKHRYLNLSRKLSLKLGNKLSDSDIANVYKYTYNKANKVLRLDFAAPIFGMSDPCVYIEFYDVWSDVSVCIPIEDPSPLGINTVFIDTVTEPPINEYVISKGGIDKSLIEERKIIKKEIDEDGNEYEVEEYYYDTSVLSEKIIKPFMCYNVRKNLKLRENNLYVVRIVSIDMGNITDLENLKYENYNSTYKLLIINNLFNAKFDEVNESGITDIDFNNLLLNNNDVELDVTPEIISKKIEDGESKYVGAFSKTTYKPAFDTEYYFSIEEESVITDLSVETQKEIFKQNAKLKLGVNLESTSSPIGNISVNNFEIKDKSFNYELINPDNYDSNVNYTVESTSDGAINVDVELITTRECSAQLTKEVKDTKMVIKNETLYDHMYVNKYNTYMPSLYFKRAIGSNRYYPKDVYDYETRKIIASGGSGVDSSTLRNAIKSKNKFGAFVSLTKEIYKKCWYKSNGTDRRQYWIPAFTKKDGSCVVLYNNSEEVVEMLKGISYVIMTNKSTDLYYYNNVSYDTKSKTELYSNIELSVDANVSFFQNVLSGDTFEQVTNSTSVLQEIRNLFELRNINDFTIRETNYFSLEDKQVNVKFEVPVPDLSINESFNNTIVNRLTNSKADLENFNNDLVVPNNVTPGFNYGPNTSQYTGKFSASVDSKNNITFSYNPTNEKDGAWVVSGGGTDNDGYAFGMDFSYLN